MQSAADVRSQGGITCACVQVPLWEMPELLCSKLVLGSLPLADGEADNKHRGLGCCSEQPLEVAVVRSVRRWNCCMTEGPLLHLAEDRREPSANALRPYFARTDPRRRCWTLQLWTSNATSTTGLRPFTQQMLPPGSTSLCVAVRLPSKTVMQC